MATQREWDAARTRVVRALQAENADHHGRFVMALQVLQDNVTTERELEDAIAGLRAYFKRVHQS